MNAHKKFQVIVVGGGPAGTWCASSLARLGVRVCLVVVPQRRASWLELVAPEAVLKLRQSAFEIKFSMSGARPCAGVIDTWNRHSPVVTDFELTRCSSGWIVDRNEFDAHLLEYCKQCGVNVLQSDRSSLRVDDFTQSSVTLRLRQTEECVEGDFIVDAAGINATLVPNRYLQRRRIDNLVAVRLRTLGRIASDEWMQLGSSSEGWWYVLSGRDESTQAVFMTDGDLLPARGSEIRLRLEQQFVEAFGHLPKFAHNSATTISAPPEITIRDARTSCRRILWSNRWMPIGDAAYSIDPISGSGITRALKMAEETATQVAEFVKTDNPTGVQQLAVQRVHEFSRLLNELCNHYASTDFHFDQPECNLFWRRRRNSRLLRR